MQPRTKPRPPTLSRYSTPHLATSLDRTSTSAFRLLSTPSPRLTTSLPSGQRNVHWLSSRSPFRPPSPQSSSMASDKLTLHGGCYCGRLRYDLNLANIDEARTSLCHCMNCKKAFGGVFGVTVKVPVSAFRYSDMGKGDKAKVGVRFTLRVLILTSSRASL
jgi:hypothetical protein